MLLQAVQQNQHQSEYASQIEKFKKNKAQQQKAAWSSRWKNELKKEEESTHRSKKQTGRRSQESFRERDDKKDVADLATQLYQHQQNNS